MTEPIIVVNIISAPMLRTTMRAAMIVMACALIAGDAGAAAPAKKPKTHTSAGVAFFAGDLSFVVVGELQGWISQADFVHGFLILAYVDAQHYQSFAAKFLV